MYPIHFFCDAYYLHYAYIEHLLKYNLLIHFLDHTCYLHYNYSYNLLHASVYLRSAY